MTAEHAAERVLRAKFLDWCSAKIADRFLALTPEEIYELAERARHGRENAFVATSASVGQPFDSDRVLPAADSSAWTEADHFRALIAAVTEVLADTLPLPTFEEWVAAYHEAPAEFERDLLGFWKEEV